MILSHRDIEEIAAAVTKDFNEFFFGPDTDGARLPRGTPIDQFASEYLGLNVSFADLSTDGSICGLTAYFRATLNSILLEKPAARDAYVRGIINDELNRVFEEVDETFDAFTTDHIVVFS